jgi:hypothetical protein
MKYILVFLLTFPCIAFAQNCGLKKEIDQFSQQPKLSTGFIKFSGTANRISVNMVADSKEIKLLFSMGEGSCFDDQSTASFSFDGSRTKSTQRNASSMNCEGIFTVVFRNASTTPSVLQKMTLQKLTSIVITDNTRKKIEINLKDDEKQWLMEKAACLVAEAKTLIKTQ